MKKVEPTFAANYEEIEGSYDMYKDWVMDDKGYFLIRINEEKERLEVGLCKEGNVILTLVHGKTPQDVYFEICKRGLISRLDHAAYLGKELEKAYLAMHNSNLEYVQDDELKL